MRPPFSNGTNTESTQDIIDISDAQCSPEITNFDPRSTPTAVADKLAVSDLVANYGSSSTTAWLEFDRYHIWRPSTPIPQSDFVPVQGYMRRDPFVFAWGNPLVSHPEALRPTALAFRQWAEEQDLRLIWSCVDLDLEQVLADPPFNWSAVHCIYEDIIDPAHVIELTSPEALGKQHGASTVKDLRKNLKRAERAGVHVAEVNRSEWTEDEKISVEHGIIEWKKSRSGVQIASTSLQPWVDVDHRRYWVARKAGKVVGFLILTPIHHHSWQIKNAVSFPNAPHGTSEALIYTALGDLYHEHAATSDSPYSSPERHSRPTVTFGITASDQMQPIKNLSGWKVTLLASIYGKVAHVAGLLRRGEFRKKFDSEHEPMYVCYPQDGFGLDGVNTLLKLLKK